MDEAYLILLIIKVESKIFIPSDGTNLICLFLINNSLYVFTIWVYITYFPYIDVNTPYTCAHPPPPPPHPKKKERKKSKFKRHMAMIN